MPAGEAVRLDWGSDGKRTGKPAQGEGGMVAPVRGGCVSLPVERVDEDGLDGVVAILADGVRAGTGGRCDGPTSPRASMSPASDGDGPTSPGGLGGRPRPRC